MNSVRNHYFENAHRPFEMEWKLFPDRLNIEDGHLRNLLPGLCQAQTQLFKARILNDQTYQKRQLFSAPTVLKT